MLERQRIAADEASLAKARAGAKLARCPHCGARGTLNAHGYLRGYAEGATETRVLRGGRLYCSNRHRRPGCGRTFSILLACYLSGFIVLAQTLFGFVARVVAGAPKDRAWRAATRGAFTCTSGYRMWRTLDRAQPTLRTLLLRSCGPPACEHHEPLAHLLAHCRASFPDAPLPFAALQSHFQHHLLMST